MKVDQNIPGTALSLKPTWDTVTVYVNIYRRIIICPRHSPRACLRNWAEFNFAGKPTVVGGCRRWNISCERHLLMQRRFDPYLQVEWLKIAPIWFAFCANLSTSVIHRRCAGDPLEQIVEHFQLQPATTSQVGRWDMRTRLYMSYIGICGPKGYMVFQPFWS